jgi:hypothetical protein
MTTQDALLAVIKRKQNKLRDAENAYVKSFLVKTTTNCIHHGRPLADKGPQPYLTTHVCKLKCMGTDERSATQCWPEKAQQCDLFTIAQSEDKIREEFRKIPEQEIILRWPTIGELIWLEKLLSQNTESLVTEGNK